MVDTPLFNFPVFWCRPKLLELTAFLSFCILLEAFSRSECGRGNSRESFEATTNEFQGSSSKQFV
eukprot:4614583-Amphidinium_carterae.1